MALPLVSVIIPVKNGVPIIGETIKSVLCQSYNNLEIIVVNDNSTDNTLAFVENLSAKDNRLIILDNNLQRHGAPVCRNMGHQHSNGKYVIFLDADDLLAYNCIENRVNKIECNPECDFYVFQCELFKKNPGDIGLYWNYFSPENDLDRFIRVDTPWHTSGPIWKHSAVSAIGGWDETIITWQDWEFHIRALVSNLIYKKEAIADFYYRKDVANSISSKDKSFERQLYLSELYGKIYVLLMESGNLTKKRKDYLLFNFIRIAKISTVYFSDPNFTLKILNNAKKINLLNGFLVYFISYMLFFFTRKNYLLNKIGWYTIKKYLLLTNNNSHLQNSNCLFKE